MRGVRIPSGDKEMLFGITLAGTRLNKKKGNSNWLADLRECIANKISPTYKVSMPGAVGDLLGIRISMHPAARPIELVCFDGESVRLSAITCDVGPGYHAAVCDFVKTIATVYGISWDPPNPAEGTGDPTGYLYMSDLNMLKQRCLEWLRESCASHLQGRSSNSNLAYAKKYEPMPEDKHVDTYFRIEGGMSTHMGFRSDDWARKVMRNPELGIDAFPWWYMSNFGFIFGRALQKLWFDTRWEKPGTDEDAQALWLLVRDLELCYRMRQDVEYPWREWHELHKLLADTDFELANYDLVAENAARCPETNIGYRRKPVRTGCGGWSFIVPGHFKEELVEEKTILESRSSHQNERTVRMSVPWKFAPKRDGTLLTPEELVRNLVRPEPMDGEILRHENALGLIGLAWWEEAASTEKVYYWLKSISAITGEAVLTGIFVEKEEDRQWAVDVWRSIMPDSHLGIDSPAIVPAAALPAVEDFAPVEQDFVSSTHLSDGAFILAN